MLWRVPRPLLLLLKTNDCLRTVDGCLGQARTPIALDLGKETALCPVLHTCTSDLIMGLRSEASSLCVVSEHLHHHSSGVHAGR